MEDIEITEDKSYKYAKLYSADHRAEIFIRKGYVGIGDEMPSIHHHQFIHFSDMKELIGYITSINELIEQIKEDDLC